MGNRHEYEAAEIKMVQDEEAARLVRAAAYKKKWNSERRSKDIESARKKEAAYMREWRAKNRERAREISRAGGAKYIADNPATRRKSAREYNARIRAELLAFFGGKCLRCGFSDSRALHLDHKNGGGNKMRKQHGLHGKWKMTKDKPELAIATFQILCANCNCIKRDEDYEYAPRARLRKAAGL